MPLRRSTVLLAVAAALGVAGAPAAAQAQGQPQGAPSKKDLDKASALYQEGLRHYNLAQFDQAVEKFREAYYLSNEPLLLFNIGQAERLKGDCEQALHSYRAYLRERPAPDNRKQVDEAVQICEEKVAAEAKQKSATAGGQGAGHRTDVAAAGGGGQGDGTDSLDDDSEIYDDQADASSSARRRIISSRVAIGPAFASIGKVDTGVLMSASIGLGYPVDLERLALDYGIVLTYVPVPWDSEMGDGSGTAALTGLLANFGMSIPLAGRLSARLDAGAGALVLSGITTRGNPFLNPDERATGALTMLHARAAAGLELGLGRTMALYAQPVLSYSPAKDLRDDITSIVRFDVLVGAGLRL